MLVHRDKTSPSACFHNQPAKLVDQLPQVAVATARDSSLNNRATYRERKLDDAQQSDGTGRGPGLTDCLYLLESAGRGHSGAKAGQQVESIAFSQKVRLGATALTFVPDSNSRPGKASLI